MLLIIEKYLIKEKLSFLPVFIQRGRTLLLVSLAWVFFRTADMTTAVKYLRAMFQPGASGMIASDLFSYLSLEILAVFAIGILLAMPPQSKGCMVPYHPG